MTEVFLVMAAAAIGLPVLVVCVVLAFFRKTRIFAVPPLIGLVGGAIAALPTGGEMQMIVFAIVFSTLCVPLAAVLGVVVAIGSVDSRWPNGVRNGLAAAAVLVVLVAVFVELDRPGSEPVRQWHGTVRNQSGAVLANGQIEERFEVALDDGRTVRATALGEVKVVEAPSFSFPDGFEAERVRVDEYRSIITGRTSYSVVRPGRR